MPSQHLQSKANPYLSENIHVMLQQESTTYAPSEYLTHSPNLTSSDRQAMASWAFDICDATNIDRENGTMGISFFDRFMSSNSLRSHVALNNRRTFQLAFVSCFILALKSRGGMAIDSKVVSELICRNLYELSEINEMEEDVLQALQWRLNGPSLHDWILRFIELLPESVAETNPKLIASLFSTAKILAEVSSLDYSLALASPSSIAFASLLNAIHCLDKSCDDSLHPCDRLEWLQCIQMLTELDARDFCVKAIQKKIISLAHEHASTDIIMLSGQNSCKVDFEFGCSSTVDASQLSPVCSMKT